METKEKTDRQDGVRFVTTLPRFPGPWKSVCSGGAVRPLGALPNKAREGSPQATPTRRGALQRLTSPRAPSGFLSLALGTKPLMKKRTHVLGVHVSLYGNVIGWCFGGPVPGN